MNSRPHFCLCCVSQHNLSSDFQPPSCVMAAASSLVASAFPSPFSRNAPVRGRLKTSLAVPVICGNRSAVSAHRRPALCSVLPKLTAPDLFAVASVTPWRVCSLQSTETSHALVTCSFPFLGSTPHFLHSTTAVPMSPTSRSRSPALPGTQKQMGQALVILVFLELITVCNIGQACLRN